MSQGVPRVIQQIPCDFKWQPSAWVSQPYGPPTSVTW